MSLVPVTRSLPAVLRDALAQGPGLRLVVGECAAPIAAPDGNAYANVIVNGVPVRVPRLRGSTVLAGAPAYLLADGDRLLMLGVVTTT